MNFESDYGDFGVLMVVDWVVAGVCEGWSWFAGGRRVNAVVAVLLDKTLLGRFLYCCMSIAADSIRALLGKVVGGRIYFIF